MPALAPPGYIPINVGVLLLIAQQFKHNIENHEDSLDYNPRIIISSSRYDEKSGANTATKFDLTLEGFQLIGQKNGYEDLGRASGVRLYFKNKTDEPFYVAGTGIKASSIKYVSLDLIPPYTECFDIEKIKNRLNKDRSREGMERPAPAGYALVLPGSLPASAGLAFQQALADGRASSLLLEANGTLTPVPENFWRTDGGSLAICGNDKSIVDLGDRVVDGRIYILASDIEVDWQIITGLRPRKIPKHLFSPYIRLAMQVSINLNLQDGRDQNNARELVKRITPEIDRLWDEYMDFDIKDVAGAKARVATIVRHPQDITGGRYTGKAMADRQVEKPKRRRKARQPQGRN